MTFWDAPFGEHPFFCKEGWEHPFCGGNGVEVPFFYLKRTGDPEKLLDTENFLVYKKDTNSDTFRKNFLKFMKKELKFHPLPPIYML